MGPTLTMHVVVMSLEEEMAPTQLYGPITMHSKLTTTTSLEAKQRQKQTEKHHTLKVCKTVFCVHYKLSFTDSTVAEQDSSTNIRKTRARETLNCL